MYLEQLVRRLRVHHPGHKLADFNSRVGNARKALDRLIQAGLSQRHRSLAELARTLNAVSPLETISRGYAVVTSTQSGEVVSSIRQSQSGQAITTQLRDGRLTSVVEKIDEETLDPL